jgi:hypothetical protein
MPQYERILLKLSGEVLAGGASFGIGTERVTSLAAEIAEVARAGVQIGLVVGGGNFFRGVAAAAKNMDRVSADQMGMLATVINALALQDALEKAGTPTRVMTAIAMPQVAEPYIRRRAIRHLEKGRGRHLQSLFLDGHGRDPSRAGDSRPGDRQGDARRWLKDPMRFPYAVRHAMSPSARSSIEVTANGVAGPPTGPSRGAASISSAMVRLTVETSLCLTGHNEQD